RREFPDLYMVYPTMTHWGARFAHGRGSYGTIYAMGTGPEWRKRDWVYRLQGRFLNQWDVDHRARVCVLVMPAGWFRKPFWADYWGGENAYQKYVKRHDLLGELVRLEDSYFRVVGVLTPPPLDRDPRWESWGTPHALLPITTFQDRVSWWAK